MVLIDENVLCFLFPPEPDSGEELGHVQTPEEGEDSQILGQKSVGLTSVVGQFSHKLPENPDIMQSFSADDNLCWKGENHLMQILEFILMDKFYFHLALYITTE